MTHLRPTLRTDRGPPGGMVDRGLMERAVTEKGQPSRWYYVTTAGAAALGHATLEN